MYLSGQDRETIQRFLLTANSKENAFGYLQLICDVSAQTRGKSFTCPEGVSHATNPPRVAESIEIVMPVDLDEPVAKVESSHVEPLVLKGHQRYVNVEKTAVTASSSICQIGNHVMEKGAELWVAHIEEPGVARLKKRYGCERCAEQIEEILV